MIACEGATAMVGLTVHFKKPADWAEPVNIHYWETGSSGGTVWAGVPMAAEGNGWYSYSFENATAASFVFNDGHGRQTGNLRRETGGWYDGGRWFEQQSVAAPAPAAPDLPPAAGAYVELVERAPFPSFDSGPCLRFPNVAQFHPLKYLAQVAQELLLLLDEHSLLRENAR